MKMPSNYQHIRFTQIDGCGILLDVSVSACFEVDDDEGPLNEPITISTTPSDQNGEQFESLLDLTIPQTKAICAALNAMLEFLAARGQK